MHNRQPWQILNKRENIPLDGWYMYMHTMSCKMYTMVHNNPSCTLVVHTWHVTGNLDMPPPPPPPRVAFQPVITFLIAHMFIVTKPTDYSPMLDHFSDCLLTNNTSDEQFYADLRLIHIYICKLSVACLDKAMYLNNIWIFITNLWLRTRKFQKIQWHP